MAYDPEGEPQILDIGSWESLANGEDVVILAVGAAVARAREAIETLSKEGYKVGLVNARFIKPLDKNLLEEIANRYEHIVTVEENSHIGGFGNYVAEYIQENIPSSIQLTHMALPDQFIEHGSRREVLELVGLSTSHITDTVRGIAERSRRSAAEVS